MLVKRTPFRKFIFKTIPRILSGDVHVCCVIISDYYYLFLITRSSCFKARIRFYCIFLLSFVVFIPCDMFMNAI